jgi:hypothetical protein
MALHSVGVGSGILDALKKRGVDVPGHVTRIVFDIGMDEIVKVYYSCHAEIAHIDVFQQVIANKEIDLTVIPGKINMPPL